MKLLVAVLFLLPAVALAAAPTSGPLYDLPWFDKDTIALADQYPQLSDDALHYLTDCELYSGDENEACRRNENGFIQDYIHAFLGSIEDRRNVAFDLNANPLTGAADPTLMRTGFTGNGIEACAWRVAIGQSGSPRVNRSDMEHAAEACHPLQKAEMMAAGARVLTLLAAWQAYAKHSCPH